MDFGFILTYVVCFVIIAYGINYSKSKRTVANMTIAKGIMYFYLAIAIFINTYFGRDTNRYITGLTLELQSLKEVQQSKMVLKSSRILLKATCNKMATYT